MGLFNFATGLVAGVYAGVFLAQNYNLPQLSDPSTMLEKIKEFAEANRKKKDDD